MPAKLPPKETLMERMERYRVCKMAKTEEGGK